MGAERPPVPACTAPGPGRLVWAERGTAVGEVLRRRLDSRVAGGPGSGGTARGHGRAGSGKRGRGRCGPCRDLEWAPGSESEAVGAPAGDCL